MKVDNNIAFRGALGDRFVQGITVHHATNVTPKLVLDSAKNKFMVFDSDKLHDIMESFINGLIRLTREKQSLQDHIDSLNNEIPKRIAQVIKATEDDINKSMEEFMEISRKEFHRQEMTIAELRRYESMAKVQSIEELDIITPEVALNTVKEIQEHEDEAKASMLTYLLTGKGQEAALAQTERANTILKADIDGTTDIAEVADAVSKVKFCEPIWYLKDLMVDALLSDEGSVILIPKAKTQIQENILGLLSPLCNSGITDVSLIEINADITDTMANLVQTHEKIAQAKKQLKKDFADAEKFVFNKKDNTVSAIDSNGTVLDSISIIKQ